MQWYAIQVRSRHEQQVARVLREKHVETFLPMYTVQRKWSTSRRTVALPLFAGYLFCSFDLADRNAVLSTRGVVRIVGVGRTPTPVDPAELDAIKAVVESGRAPAPCGYIKMGERVQIESGPLAGTKGILLHAKNERLLVVSITLLQRSVSVTLESESVRPASGTA